MLFIILRYVPSIPTWMSIYHEWMYAFSAHFEIIMIFIISFVNVVYHIDCFMDVETSLDSWNKSHLIVLCDYFHILLNSVCH